MALRNVTFKKTNVGGNSGDYFISIDSPRTLLASNVTRAQLEAGYTINNVDVIHTVFIISSTGVCNNSTYVTISYTAPPGDTTVPSDVSGTPTATNVTGNSLTLNWSAATDNIGIAGYKIYDFEGVLLYTTTGTGLSYNITGLTAGTAYTYRVKSYDTAGNESISFSGTLTVTLTSDTTAPTAPVLSIPSAQGTTVELNWEASTDGVGVTGYEVYRNTISRGTTTTLTFSDITIQNTTYSYKIQAYDAANNRSPFSNTRTVDSGSAL